MSTLISLQVTIFTMVIVGALMVRTGLVSKAGRTSISNLVIYVVLPCSIFNSFLSGVSKEQVRDCIAVLLIAAAIQFILLVYGKFRYRRDPDGQKQNLQFSLLISNAGFMGFPMAEGVFGSIGLLYASIYVIPQRIMMWTSGLTLYSGESDIKAACKKVLLHPAIISCELGILVMLTGITLPHWILQPVQTLARCNTALSMMIVGFVFGDLNLKGVFEKPVIIFTIERLITIPLCVWFVCRLLPVSSTTVGVCTLLAAMPGAAMTSVLAAKYDCDPEFATKLVILSTLCSIPTLMVWSAVLT